MHDRHLVDMIDVVMQACLAVADKAMRAGGFVPQPQIHLLIDRWVQPYIGYVFYDAFDTNTPMNAWTGR